MPVTGLPTYIANSALPVGFLDSYSFLFHTWEDNIAYQYCEVKLHGKVIKIMTTTMLVILIALFKRAN